MKISTIITTRNRAHLLPTAIESVLNQEPFGTESELIVVDDDSSDTTAEVVTRYPDIRFYQTKQGTASGSRNIGIAEAEGDWIAFLDDDDAWLPEKLKTCIGLIDTHPKARIVYTAGYICDHLLRGRETFWYGPDLSRYASAYEAFLDEVMSPSMFLIHRDVFQTVGDFDTTLPRAEDREMLCRAALHGFEAAGTPEPLMLYRLRKKEEAQMLYDTYSMTIEVLHRYFQKSNEPPKLRQQAIIRRVQGFYVSKLMALAQQENAEGNMQESAKVTRLAFSISPAHLLKHRLTSLTAKVHR